MRKNNKCSKLIHIVAESNVYSYYGVISEEKTVKKLEEIRDAFSLLDARHPGNNKLSVRTSVHNPELPFGRKY